MQAPCSCSRVNGCATWETEHAEPKLSRKQAVSPSMLSSRPWQLALAAPASPFEVIHIFSIWLVVVRVIVVHVWVCARCAVVRSVNLRIGCIWAGGSIHARFGGRDVLAVVSRCRLVGRIVIRSFAKCLPDRGL